MVSLYFSHVDGFGSTAALPANDPMLPKAFGKCNPNKRLAGIAARQAHAVHKAGAGGLPWEGL
ncbi:hypothetical protein [Pseudomonas leptonychotis]|uniref:hypothetical protein n=1 Tax=Pseudomonas leptonychotis TaxID=2448482 RepID=UPI00386F32EE